VIDSLTINLDRPTTRPPPDGADVLLLLAVHLAAALCAPVLVGRLGRKAFWVLALAPASAAVWALAQTNQVMAGRGPVEVVQWIPTLGIELAFRLDTLSWLMALLVGAIGALVLVYSSAYFSVSATGLGRFGSVLVAFAGAMLGLVTADDTLLMFVFWELTTVLSYLLIGHYNDRKVARRASMQAIVITTAGGLTMLVGIILIGHAAGTHSLSATLANPPHGPAVTAAVVCLLVGAAAKSALIPLHFWLPAAMAAPTPVSAYLHAAAMVKAGVYLVARFAPAYADLAVWQVIVLTLGCGTMLLGGYRALRQHDLKLVLAFGTVSQLGLLVLLVGFGTRAAALAGLALLGAHAMFKAALFLVVGVVDAATGTRDLRRLSGVGRALPVTATVAALAVASMIGLPPFAGYVAKEAALEAIANAQVIGGVWVARIVFGAVVVGSMLTVAYGLRLLWGAFATKTSVIHAPTVDVVESGVVGGARAAVGPRPVEREVPAEPATITRPSRVLLLPPLVLAVLGLLVALLPGVGQRLLEPHADAYPGEPGHLTLWAGLTPTLLLTLLVLAVGLAVFWGREPIERFQAAVSRAPDVDRVYRRMMRRLDEVAGDVTAFTQRGSLPIYLGLILVVFAAAVGLPLLATTSLPSSVRAWDHPAQAVFGVLIVAAAILAARSRRRLKAVILLGVSGYGVAALFLLHGAPDLALTQVLAETVTLVVFVLVLRRLPPYFSDRPLAASRWVRLGVGLAVGLTVGGLQEHRQRDPRGHPGVGHDGRDLGPARGRDRRRVARLPPASRRGHPARRRRPRGRTRVGDRHRPDGRAASTARPARAQRHEHPLDRVAPGRQHARTASPVGDLRGHDAAAVPHDDRVLGVPAVLGSQRPRRRLRGGARDRHRARGPLPRGRTLRAGRGRAGPARSAARPGPVHVGGRRDRRADRGRVGPAVVDRGRLGAGARERAPRDVAVLRRGGVPRRRRPGARRAADARR
jgi:multicomponent Na+:H+ antiporter subunit A